MPFEPGKESWRLTSSMIQNLTMTHLFMWLQTGPEKGNIFAKGIKFQTKSPDNYHMAFGDDIAKGFYSYLLIKNGEATIATVLWQ